MKIHFVWRHNVANVGDVMSSPFHYFDFDASKVVHDYKAFDFSVVKNEDAVIVGGGVCRNMLSKRRNPHPLVIGWGVGTSIHGRTWLKGLDYGGHLNGVRDWPTARGDVHVPCASAMHPAFDTPYRRDDDGRLEAVLFTNHDPGAYAKHFPAIDRDGMPWLHNHMRFEDIVAAFKGASTIVTNSYHGAYWGQLLGRKVVVVNAYSSKFHNFRWPVAVAAPGEDWRAARDRHYIEDPTLEPLAYARAQNTNFHKTVQDRIRRHK